MPYRTTELNCPQCRVALGSTSLCPKCGGGWVSESSLRERLEAVTVDNTQLPDFAGFAKTGAQKHECPMCYEPLDVVRVGDIEVERCAKAHGIWFEPEELQAVLLKASAGKDVDSSSNMDVVKPTLFEALVGVLVEDESILW